MQRISSITVVLLAMLLPGHSGLGQALFQGPATGSVSAGASVSTADFSAAAQQEAAEEEGPIRFIPEFEFELKPNPPDQPGRVPAVNSLIVEDEAATLQTLQEPTPPDLLSSFIGIGQTAFIPPDPHMAAGPDHIMVTVNSDFAIYDKDGTQIFRIDAESWFDNVLPDGGPFDPQIAYDHIDDRWVMVWVGGDIEAEAYYLVSVSDDSDPTGTWCNWALDATVDGSTESNDLNDYPKLGFDEDAVYVTANMFELSDFSFEYVKIRILPKDDIYSGTCGMVEWTDFWDLREPDDTTVEVFTVVPAVTFGSPGVEYLINDSPYVTGDFMTVWKLTDPLGLADGPNLTAENVPVATSTSPPNAEQLGGTTGLLLIDVGGRRVRNAVYKDGSLWTAHSVAGGTDDDFAFMRYVRIDVGTDDNPTTPPALLEDVRFGVDDFYYYYPAIQVDNNNNIVIGFTRSGASEYAGAFYTGRLDTDPPGLAASSELKAGEATYVQLDNSNRNRWGDYMGIALDPGTGSIWTYLEYAVDSDDLGNDWGTWIGELTYVEPPVVVINEVVTSPQNDWSDSEGGNGTGYDNLPGNGVVDLADQWIELYNGDDSAVDLTANGGWELIMTDSAPDTLNFANLPSETGLFFSDGGSTTNFQPGEYLIIGDPPGALDDDVYVELRQP